MAPLLALLAGALLPLSFAPFHWWPLGFVSLGAWFALLRRPGVGGASAGWAFGVGKYGVGASWVYVSIHDYGGAAAPLAVFLVAVFVAGLAVFAMANAWLFQRLRRGGALADALLFAVLFTAFEWLLTWALTGFPWLYAGYAHLHTPLAGWAPVGGVLSLGFITALGAALLAAALECLRRRHYGAAGLAVALALAPWPLGLALGQVTWVAPGETRQTVLVQGNVDQSVKWRPENRVPILRNYQRLSEPHWGVDLMIWPEAALTFTGPAATPVLEALDDRASDAGTTLVLGLPAVERAPGGGVAFHNTARVMGDGTGRYLKRRLVPFGEYVPLESWLRGTIDFFDLPMSHARPGPWRQPLLDLGGERAVMAICYEVVYPDLVRSQAAVADVLLTISNDAWFGASLGPLQHLQMAQMRALENGRWMLRATNNGVTAIIDHTGAIRERLPQFESGALRGEYTVMEGTTPFTRYGHLPLLAGLVAAGLAGAWRRRR